MTRDFVDYLSDMLAYALKARDFQEIPWKQIVAMRNILIHNYEGADYRIVHRTATANLKELIELLPKAIEAARGI